jgi:putative membrane protein
MSINSRLPDQLEPVRPGLLRVLRRTLWPPLPVWKRLDAAVLGLVIYTSIIVVVVNSTDLRLPDWSGFSTVLNALVLGLLLGFRTQVAYDRWWEGRRLWGQLTNDARAFGSKVAAFGGLSDATGRELANTLHQFAVALKDHLRSDPSQAASAGSGAVIAPLHKPVALLARLTKLLEDELVANRISELGLLRLDPHLRGFFDVCGACERIKNTPIPKSYRALLRHGLVLYLLSTPWLVADHLMYWTIPTIALLGYFLVGVELTGEDVEEPFGRDRDDLALSTYCETIRLSLVQTLGDWSAAKSQ